jgi:membrane protease YdiL (CAAX protease family)
MDNSKSDQHKKKTFITGIFMLVGVMCCMQIGVRQIVIHFFGFIKPSPVAIFFSSIYYWLLTVGIWIYARRVERQKFSLWEEKKHNILTYFLSVLAIFGTIIIASGVLQSILFAILHHKEKSVILDQMIAIFRKNKLLLVFVTLTAGVTEELIFRVYLMQRLEFVLKNTFLPIVVTTVLFALTHIGYGTFSNILGPFIIGGTFAIHYQLFKNIKFIIIFHFLWDLLVLTLMLHNH